MQIFMNFVIENSQYEKVGNFPSKVAAPLIQGSTAYFLIKRFKKKYNHLNPLCEIYQFTFVNSPYNRVTIRLLKYAIILPQQALGVVKYALNKQPFKCNSDPPLTLKMSEIGHFSTFIASKQGLYFKQSRPSFETPKTTCRACSIKAGSL